MGIYREDIKMVIDRNKNKLMQYERHEVISYVIKKINAKSSKRNREKVAKMISGLYPGGLKSE